MKKNTPLERLWNGIIKENPTFILMLGMCPTLAVTTGAINGLGMGLSTAAVLIMSNMVISLLRKVIPGGVRMPAYIVIVASFVTIIEMLLHAFVTSVYDSLGIFIPLIVVNCIILGRAEAYASKNKVIPSIFDGLGMGLGFTVALTLIGMVREFLGAGTLFGIQVIPDVIPPITIFILAPGAFFVLACLTALQNKLNAPSATNRPEGEASMACGGNCAKCAGSCGAGNHQAVISDVTARKEAEAQAAKAAAAEKKAAADRAKALQAEKAAQAAEKAVGGDNHD
ncbi:MAG: electron transport complex subunit E [Ruminococcaceae bacterium]|nr:electron transport complex subunit E [Oscillospiraceae bacterium]